MNENDYNFMVKLKKEFEDRIFEIIEIMAKTENKRFKIDELQNIEIEDENICIQFEERYNGGCDYYNYSFPKNYLFNDNWIEEYKEKIRLENEAKKLKKEQERQVLIEFMKQGELKTLKKLKEKYEKK